MDEVNIEANEILEALQAEFPMQFTIVVQRIHIKKLNEKLQALQEFKEVIDAPTEH